MKQIVLVTFSVLLMSSAYAQRAVDVGLWGGASSYFGDMTKVNTQSSLSPAYGGYLRYNFNPRYGVRVGYITGNVRGEGEFEENGMIFEKNINDFHILGEFNFFKYIMGSNRHPITTYLLGGVGASFYQYNYDPVFLNNIRIQTLPELSDSDTEDIIGFHSTVGFGFKFNIGTRWGVGAEAQLRKYFNDKLDDLDDPRKSIRDGIDPITGDPGKIVTTYTDTWHNNDWLVHFGVHVSYRFYLGKKDCPVYENLN